MQMREPKSTSNTQICISWNNQ